MKGMADKRDCPECGTRMESKGSMNDFNDESGNYDLYQCPKCKNVEILWEGS
jgi:tRNA(Ile2) C34 agmatinyltransferase TiaS